MDREIRPIIKDLQSTTTLAESLGLKVFDMRVDFPVPVQIVVVVIFLLSLSIPMTKPDSIWLEIGANLGKSWRHVIVWFMTS